MHGLTSQADLGEAFWGIVIFWVAVFGVVCGAIWQSKGGSFGAGFLIGGLLGIIGLLIVAFAKPGGATNVPTQPATLMWTHSGERYLLSYTLDPPAYGIWDRNAPGPPVEKFPYSEYGKSEALARYAQLEPGSLEVQPTSQVPPPPSAAIVWTHSGQRYLLGYALDPPSYGIWDRQTPGPPMERFPYDENGRHDSLTRFAGLEPQHVEVGKTGALPPPPSG